MVAAHSEMQMQLTCCTANDQSQDTSHFPSDKPLSGRRTKKARTSYMCAVCAYQNNDTARMSQKWPCQILLLSDKQFEGGCSRGR